MINIQNENLANYVMFKLGKIENAFTLQELATLEELVVNPVDIINESTPINLDVLNYFVGLKNLELVNLYISNKDVEILNRLSLLKTVVFDSCKFENFGLVCGLKIKELEVINCKQDISSVYSMKHLQSLTIINNKISIEKINGLTNLNYLQISHSDIMDKAVVDIANLQELYIDGTNITDLTFVKKLTNLKKLSVSQVQIDNNINLIKDLIKRGVVVMLENMVDLKVMEVAHE